MSDYSADQITHDGLIKEVNEDKIMISIVSMASCASCQVKGACSASDVEEKIVEVKKIPGREYQVGEFVTIVINQSVGMWAVLFGYVFPLIVVVVSLIVFSNIVEDQGLAGLISIALLVPYYSILYYSRKKMTESFEFRLR